MHLNNNDLQKKAHKIICDFDNNHIDIMCLNEVNEDLFNELKSVSANKSIHLLPNNYVPVTDKKNNFCSAVLYKSSG